MTHTLRTALAAAALVAAAPALGQTLLLDISTTVPLAAALDNPCTVAPEAIAFTGNTAISQRVWLMPDGKFRLQYAENTAMQGQQAGSLTPVTYAISGASERDLEVDPVAFEVLSFKKVSRTAGLDDNFYTVLVLSFDPQNLQLRASLESACDTGLP
jgi:hypothetical protein